jgi:pimeloyl-ACP methyl ester carboxylesterase
MRLFSRPWNLALSNIPASARLWFGDADRNVPHAAARRLAAAIPGCEITLLPGHGHFWIFRNCGEVLRWLAA